MRMAWKCVPRSNAEKGKDPFPSCIPYNCMLYISIIAHPSGKIHCFFQASPAPSARSGTQGAPRLRLLRGQSARPIRTHAVGALIERPPVSPASNDRPLRRDEHCSSAHAEHGSFASANDPTPPGSGPRRICLTANVAVPATRTSNACPYVLFGPSAAWVRQPNGKTGLCKAPFPQARLRKGCFVSAQAAEGRIS